MKVLPSSVRTSWEQKVKEREQLKALKQKEQAMKQEKEQRLEVLASVSNTVANFWQAEKQQRLERKRKREENEQKSTTSQVVRAFLTLTIAPSNAHQIRDVKKIKKMTKKQFRALKKI